jgi:hypothetical protein
MAPNSSVYRPDEAVCALPPATPTGPQCISDASVSALTAGAQELVDHYSASAYSSAPGPTSPNCGGLALKAGATCGKAVLSTVTALPDLGRAFAEAVLGGIQCGVASAEAYECFEKQP